MKLPLLISVPHAGVRVPPEVSALTIISEDDIIRDGDEGAADIYAVADRVAAYVSTDVARAFLDMNRAEDDRSADGVVKTHTCWNVQIYREPLPEDIVESLIQRYYRPYHEQLSKAARAGELILGIDCHTMAQKGPPIGPDPGRARPLICLSYSDGTCPRPWIELMASFCREEFGEEVRINDPFTGGHLIRAHAGELPWMQFEINRAPFADNRLKRRKLIAALTRWCERMDLDDFDAE